MYSIKEMEDHIANIPSSQLTSLISVEETGGPTRPVVLSQAKQNEAFFA